MARSVRFLVPLFLICILSSAVWAEDAATFTIHGKALEKGTRKPLEGMAIHLQGHDEPEAITDKDGKFTLSVNGTGDVTLIASGPGYDRSEPVTIVPAELKTGADVKLYLLPIHSMIEVVVEADRNQDKTGKTVVSGKELASVAGSAGDPLRGMQALPGITTANDASSAPAIRGTGPQDNFYYADFMPVGYLFHMGGMVSVFNADLVDDFNIYASAFGPEFTDVTGAIIDVKLRDPRTDRLGVKLNISTLEADALIEGPVSETQSFYVGARRSYIDLLLRGKDLGTKDGVTITQFPEYNDYQAKYLWKISADNMLTFEANGAEDEMKLTIGSDSDIVKNDPVLAGGFSSKMSYNSQSIVLATKLSPRVNNKLGISHLGWYMAQDLGQAIHVNLKEDVYYLREQVGVSAGNAHELLFGLEYGAALMKVELDAPNTMPSIYNPDTDYTSAARISYHDRFSANFGSFFAKDRWRLFEPFTLVVGGRASYEDYLHTSEYEPRLSAEYQASQDTLVTAGWGKYHQFPQGHEVIPKMGNPKLDNIKADHYNLGMERRLTEGWSTRLEVYYKDLYDLVVPDAEKNYVNGGSGKAYGSELLIKKNKTDAWSGWIAATYSRTERRNDMTGEKFPYSYDQPVVLNLVYEWYFMPQWTFGAKWRYQSGAPYTPVIGTYTDTYVDAGGTTHTRTRPRYGEIGSERLPEYHRLDLRIARNFVFDTSKMSVYFELINAYDHKNISNYSYSDNYTTKKPVEQLPIMPAFGIMAEF